MAATIGGGGRGCKRCHAPDMARMLQGATLAGRPRLRVTCRIISEKRPMPDDTSLPILTPDTPAPEAFTDPQAAVRRLEELFRIATEFLAEQFNRTVLEGRPAARVRAFYPEIRLTDDQLRQDRQPPELRPCGGTGQLFHHGHAARPVPQLPGASMIGLLVQNHGVPVMIGASDTPIPVHFAVAGNPGVSVPQEGVLDFSIRDVFDVPDLATTNDDIVNGTRLTNPDGSSPLAPFSAQRVDYSLARLTHYTATDPAHFQNHVLFTNYQFYVDEFEAFAREALADKRLGYTSFVATGEPGDRHAGRRRSGF